MTASPAFFPLLRRIARWLAALAALAALGFAVAAALMFFWVLPHIAEHRDTVAQLMSRALGQRVTLASVSGVWQQARPEFHLRGVHLYDPQGRPALFLPELEAEFAWRSLLFLEPRFSRIELRGLTLGVRRARDGRFYVGGIPVNPAAPDSGFSSWLLRQGRVHADRAVLTWLDEVRGAPPLTLTAVDFTLTNVHRRHRLQLHAIPPARLARPLTIDAQLTARDVDDLETWNGRIAAGVAGVSFPQLARWLALPYQPQRGWGALQIVFEVARGELTGATAGVDLRSLEIPLAADLPVLRLAQVSGQARWARGPGGAQRLAFDRLRVALPGGAASAPFSTGLSWNGSARELTAQALRLDGWQPFLPSLPMDAALRQQLQALQPQGRIDSLRLRWKGGQPGLDNFKLLARFTGLGVAASDSHPGVAHLSGRIEGDAAAGTFEIDAPGLTLNLPMLFREPLLGFDRLHARGGWKKTARGRLLTLADAAFHNRDAAGMAKGQFEWIAGHPGVIDLSAHLSRADGRAVYRYLPKSIGDYTVNWVRDAVLAGYSDDVQLVLQGDLAKFPFDQGGGRFSVGSKIKDAVIDYVPGWPRIDGIQARMLFQGRTMEVTSSRAQIFGVALAPVRAFIPDMVPLEKTLQVNGQAVGPIQDFIRFAQTSPVGKILRGFTDGLEGGGPMRLALKLNIPLNRSDDSTLTGKLSFVGDSLHPAGLPQLDQARGDIDFTESALSAKNITAQFLGGPLRVDVVTRKGLVQIAAQGQATAAGVIPWLGAAMGKHLSGQAAWRGQIDLAPEGERIRIESDLLGLGSSLPAPLAKAAAQPLPLAVTRQPQAGGQQYEVRLGKTVGAVWRSTADEQFSRGEIRFGGQPTMPGEPGLRLAGSGRGLDISGWMALLPGGEGGGALALSAIDLNFDALDLMGRRFQNVRLQGRSRSGLLRTQVSGRELSGVLTYRPAGAHDSTGAPARSGSEPLREHPARISAQFRQLVIPEVAPAAGPADALSMKAADFPQLDVVVEDFRLQARPLGRLEGSAHGEPQGLVIENLQLTHADSVFRMSGLWRDGGQGETRADLNLNVLDAGKFLARFGYADALKRGSAEIQGNASWEGSPADFTFGTLAGQLDFKAGGGQFSQIDPGVGKLLGVLSLQSLPRRLNFDFHDIFSKGYAFDDIKATLRIARGVVYSDDFKMRGPAAKVNMSGLADLNQESVQLRVKVIPKVSEGVAVAGALIGGPLAGVGVLAAQKLLRDPIEEAISQDFMVTGAWLTPEVKRLPRTRTETPATEP